MARQRSGKRTRKGARAPANPPRRQSRPPLPPPSLKRELLQIASTEARFLRRALSSAVVLAAITAAGWGVWSLRPMPSYTSGEVEVGSPFDVSFQMENTNPWLPMANLRLACVLDHVRASGLPPALVEATNVRFAGVGTTLQPGERATFTCPFRALIGHPINEDAGVAQRAEIYFRVRYDEPLLGKFQIADNSAPFFLNTRLLPPRWTATAR